MIGTLGITRLNFLSLMYEPSEKASVKAGSISGSFIQRAASLLLKIRTSVPLWVLKMVLTFASFGLSMASIVPMASLALVVSSVMLLLRVSFPAVLCIIMSICLALYSKSPRTLGLVLDLLDWAGLERTASWYLDVLVAILSAVSVTLPILLVKSMVLAAASLDALSNLSVLVRVIFKVS